MGKKVIEKSDGVDDGSGENKENQQNHHKTAPAAAPAEDETKLETKPAPKVTKTTRDFEAEADEFISETIQEFMKTNLEYKKLEKLFETGGCKAKLAKKIFNEAIGSFTKNTPGSEPGSTSSESSRTTSSSDNDVIEYAFTKKSMKGVVSLVEYADRKGISEDTIDKENIKPYEHEECEFLSICSCDSCLQFRGVITGITLADRNANLIWNAFKNSLVICYKTLFQKFPNATQAVADYKKALNDPSMRWLVSGPMTDSVFLQILHNMDTVPVADKLLFIVLVGIMGKYDPYQLLELLAFNIKCVCKVYADHLQSIIDKSEGGQIQAKEFITLLVDGYEELLRVVKKTIPIIYEYEVHYLRKFGIYWSLLHRRIYQKLVYIPFATVVLKCLVELKKKEEDELFKRYLSFDVDFCKMDYLWEPVWDKLDEYNSSLEQLDRHFQIEFISKSFFLLQSDSLPPKEGTIPLNKWVTHENRELVWKNILHYIRKNWPKTRRSCNLYYTDKCEKCLKDLDLHENNCDCVTCTVAGPKRFIKGNNETKQCSKCVNITGYCEVFPGKKLYDHIAKNHPKDDSEQYFDCENESLGSYHISWAIFKQIKSRKPYTFRTLDEKYFCYDCKEHTCWIARKIMNNKITKNLSNYLIDNYIDIPIAPSEVAPMMTEIMLYISQLYDDPKCIDKEFEEDEILMYFWTIVVTLFAKCFKDEINNTGVNLDLFEVVEKDIRLKRGQIKGDEDSILIRSLLYKMGTSCDSIFPATRNETTDETGSISFDSIDDQNLSDSSESHADECPHMRDEKGKRKEKPSGKKRSKKDCSHARVNETRDRLRQKLKNAKNTPPPPPPASTEEKYQYVCEGVSNMKIEGKGNMSIKITTKHKGKPPEPTSTHSSNGNSRTSSVANNVIHQMSIQETLSFIEGKTDTIKKPLDDKKVAKKAKQKLKKEESRRIGELQELKEQFHEIYFKEFLMKDDLKKLKSSKSKNKKKINELEIAVKKLNKSKSQVEASILDLISTIKITNLEFKFTYLPTKEQQQEFLKSKEGQTSKKSTPTPPPTPQPSSLPQMGNFSSTVRLSFAHPSPNDGGDPSKRMVTIRRVNLPNVSEPQVTVTAKGMAPGQDELLYRFINGQLVQAKLMKEASQMQQQKQQQQQLQNQQHHPQNQPQQAAPKQKAKKQIETIQEPEVKKKTKTQIKKEKKEAKLLEQEKERQRLEKENSKKPDLNANTTPHNRNKSEVKKESQQKEIPLVSKKVKQKVVDNGQFDNNQFKMLHMEDFVTESSESEEHSSSIEEKVVPVKQQQPSKKAKDKKQNKSVEVKQTQKTVDIKNTTNGLTKKSKKTKIKDVKPVAQTYVPESNMSNVYNPSVYPTPPPSVFDFYHPQTGHHQLRPQYHEQHKMNPQLYQHMNNANTNSIMEQLNRGVQVEHLTLPPGITLTKIDPSKAEALRAKTESIGKLSKPMEQVVNPTPQPPPSFYQHIIAGGYNQPAHDPSGIIMVDAMGVKQQQNQYSSNAPTMPDDKMAKNKKKKNKKKSIAATATNTQQPQKPTGPQMVTLKNPMFHGQFAQNVPSSFAPAPGLPNKNISMGEQPAKIIKNDNGMFTIRRSGPELGMNYQNSGPINPSVPNYTPFAPKYYPTPSVPETNYLNYGSNYYNGQSEDSEYSRPGRCISAIGSEIKNAQQQKKSKEWIGSDKCCASNNSNSNSCSGGGFQSNSFFSGFDSFPSTSTHSSVSPNSYLPSAPSNCGSLFDNAMAHHNCDDSPPPIPPSIAAHDYKPYLEGIPNTGVISYNDASILKNLMPGQKLNNEVSIHNINESNFARNHVNPSPNRVDITPIFGHRGHEDFGTGSGRNSSSFVDFQGGLFPSKNPDELNLSDPIDANTFNKIMNANPMNANTANRENHSRTSPFLDNATLESFIQNMGSLNLAGEGNRSSPASSNQQQQHHSPEKVSWW